jgi:hypothetical protein
MKRRNLIVASAGIVGGLFSALIQAATPCPPPQVGVAGGTNATTTCTVASGSTYSTNFAAAENPLSEGGKWINGQAVGLDWLNAQSSPGKAYGSAIATGYNDDIGVLNTTFTANQFAQGTVYRAPGYSPGASHEIELLLHFQITAHSARGYEVLWGHTGEVNIVRWNGPLGNYTPLLSVTGPNIGAAVDGDVLRAEIIGTVIKVYKNGTLVLTGPSNTSWTDGQPGMGFWPTTGATPANYGWKSYTAGGL